jgi:hypothetical protein
VSNKVPGQSEKWDDVIRQLTSVWTPESAARVLAAIAQLDLHGSSSEGDVITRVGDKFIPQAPGAGGPTKRVYAWSGTVTIAPAGSSVMDWSTATRQDHQGVPSGAPVGFTVDAGDHTKLLVTTAGLYYCLASLLVRGAITTQTELEVLSNFAYVLDETCVVPVSTNGRDFNFPLVQYFAAGAGIGVEVDNLGGQSVDLDLRMTLVRIGSAS